MTKSHISGSRVLRYVGAIVAALGGVLIFVGLGLDNWICQSLGLVAAVTGSLVIKVHAAQPKFHGHSDTNSNEARVYGEQSKQLGVAVWTWAIGSTLACIASFGAMYVDQAYGGHWVWPVYAAGVTGVICACAWGYIAAKIGWFTPY